MNARVGEYKKVYVGYIGFGEEYNKKKSFLYIFGYLKYLLIVFVWMQRKMF